MRMVHAGDMRHVVTVQQRAVTVDSYGEQSTTWSDLHEPVFAAIEPLSGRELIAALSEQSEITHKVRIRYLAGVAPKHRLVFGARYFDILAVRDVDERNREMELLCSEGMATG